MNKKKEKKWERRSEIAYVGWAWYKGKIVKEKKRKWEGEIIKRRGKWVWGFQIKSNSLKIKEKKWAY